MQLKFDPSTIYDRPQVMMVPLIDIMFFALVFFMILSVYYHVESNMDIKIPEASSAMNNQHEKTEMVININSAGNYIVNGKSMNSEELENVMKKSNVLNPNSVIIRADQKAYHQYVIKVLDICARNNIKDVSFATSEAEK